MTALIWQHHQWIFSRLVVPSDWPRFQFYAHRIKHFEYREAVKQQRIDASVYAEVARTRPTFVLLPTLTRLVWDTKLLNQAILFMHPTVTQLVVHIDEPSLDAHAFLVVAASCLPNLTLLAIHASFPVRDVQTALLHLLGGVLQLQTVILPRYWLSSSVLSVLASLPRLEVILWGYTTQGVGDPRDVEAFNVILPDGAFPNLNDLSLEVHLSDAEEFIRSSYFPSQIAYFSIQSLQFPSPSAVERFLTSSSTNLRSLTSTWIYLCQRTSKIFQNRHVS